MDFNLRQFKKFTKKRKDDLNYETKPIGSAIKLKRRQMQMTLEEGSEGICSVSYLSKLENNQIACNDVFLDQLLERFCLKEDYTEHHASYHHDLHQMLDALFHQSIYQLDFTEHYGDRIDHQALLIRIGYYYTRREFLKAKTCYEDIKTLIPLLSDLEFSMLSYMLADILFFYEQYHEAFEVIEMPTTLKDLPESLSFLIQGLRIKLAFKLKQMDIILNEYQTYIAQTMNHYHMHLFDDIKRKYIEFESEFAKPKQLHAKIGHLKKLSDAEKTYALMKSHYHHQDYEAVMLLAQKIQEPPFEMTILHLMALDQMGLKDQISLLIDTLPPQKELSDACQKIVRHLKFKYAHNKTQLLNYLRNDILGFKHITDHLDVLEYLMFDTQQIFSSFQYYKEANQAITEIMPKIKALKMA